MATIKNIKRTPSGIYATAIRGSDEADVILSRQLPRWNYVNSGSYIEIDQAEWEMLISDASPTPAEIREARGALSQTAAAMRIHSTMRTWQDWEAGIAKMHPGLWELFLLKRGQ